MIEKKVKWGVLGFARIAMTSIIPAMIKSDNSEFIAVASRDSAKLDTCCSLFGERKKYSNYDTLLNDPDIDAVYIPLPNSMHREWACKAMERGKHVLCEKPISLTAHECDEMIECSVKNKVVLMESFMYQYSESVKISCKLVKEGVIGDLRQISSTFRFFLDRPGNIRLQPILGGGSLYDVGCYPVHYIGLLMNSLPVAKKAEAVFEQGVDTQFCGVLRYENGVIANVNCGFNAFREQHSRIIGTKGIINVPDTFAGKKGVVSVITDSECKEIEVGECDRYREVVTNFSNALLGKPAELVPLENTLRNMRIIEGLLGAV